MAAIETVLLTAYGFIQNQGTLFRLDDTSRPELRRVALPQMLALQKAQRKWAIFLPKQMNEDIENFMRVFRGVTAPPQIALQYPADMEAGLLNRAAWATDTRGSH